MPSRHKQCQCGQKRARWGTKETGRVSCDTCKTEGMVNLDALAGCGCAKNVTPSFGFPGRKAKHCNSCKQDGMINIRRLEKIPKTSVFSIFERAELRDDMPRLHRIAAKYPILDSNNRESLQKRQFLIDIETMIDKYGVQCLTTDFFKEHPVFNTIKNQCQKFAKTYKTIAESLNLSNEYEKFRAQHRRDKSQQASVRQGKEIWTDEKIDETAKEIISKYNGLPVREYLISHGYAHFVAAAKRMHQSLDILRKRYDVSIPARMKDIRGNIFKSYCETALSNFLIVRGLDTIPGKKYDITFKKFTNNKRGKAYYDLHFVSPISGKTINVEIFGGGRNGNANDTRKQFYAETKQLKLDFHKDNRCFLAINWQDCYHDDKLEEILMPLIGRRDVIIQNKLYVNIAATKWSLLDEVLEVARQVYDEMDNVLPPVSWFLKNRNYSDREILPFEKDNWQGFVDNIFTVGGFRLVRKLLGQIQSEKIKWDSNYIIQEFKEVHRIFGRTPYAVHAQLKKLNSVSEDQKKWISRCDRMTYHARKTIADGHRGACKLAGILVEPRNRIRA